MEASYNESVPYRAKAFDNETKPLRQLNSTPHNYEATTNTITSSGGATKKLSIDAAAFIPSSNIQQRLYNVQHSRESIPTYFNQTIGNPEQHPEQQQRMANYGGGVAYMQTQQHSSQTQHQYHQQQQQQQQQLYGNMHYIPASVQDRLKVHNNVERSNFSSSLQPQHHHQSHLQQQQQHQHYNNHHQQYHYNNYEHNQGYQGYRQQNQGHNNHQQQHQQHNRNQHQSRHNQSHVMAQNQQQQQQQSVPVAAAAAESTNDMENIALDYLQTVIHCLNQNPGQFDSIASRFLTIFDGMENNFYVLSIAMEDIFEESIAKPNFRYMGAKLYNLLHMLNPHPDSLFHTLLKRKLNFHQTEVKKFMQECQNKVRETALFLAELYMQLRGDEFRIHLIAENIVYSLKQLLTAKNSENVRCICLTLKLAGYDLTTDCPQDMDFIIARLDAINSQSPGEYPLADNVITLQKNNWGRKVSGYESPSIDGDGDGESRNRHGLPVPPRVSNDPVFYGPDGREITEEECEFLTTNVNGLPGSDDNEDIGPDSDIDYDPEMDEETEHAYKEFIKQSKAS